MSREDFNLETRFSRTRGVFPYIAGLLGLVLVVLIFMYATGIGREMLPYSEFFERRAPTAPDGSEALSLKELNQKTDEKTTLSIEGMVLNRTDDTISGLQAVITVTDKFTFPLQTLNVPVEPVELPANGMGVFRTTVALDDKGLGGYSVNFRLPDEGPFVPHLDERTVEPVLLSK
ncbi:MAG TPA: hypothetical protein VFR05_09680 [Terriglobia bacterium]|nr:hypothetical protein [Terriglobia bacterium]